RRLWLTVCRSRRAREGLERHDIAITDCEAGGEGEIDGVADRAAPDKANKNGSAARGLTGSKTTATPMVGPDAARGRVLKRNRQAWTGRFPTIVQATSGLKARSCLIDGEVVCCDENRLAVFALLRYRERPAAIFLYAFDLLELDARTCRTPPRSTFDVGAQ